MIIYVYLCILHILPLQKFMGYLWSHNPLAAGFCSFNEWLWWYLATSVLFAKSGSGTPLQQGKPAKQLYPNDNPVNVAYVCGWISGLEKSYWVLLSCGCNWLYMTRWHSGMGRRCAWLTQLSCCQSLVHCWCCFQCFHLFKPLLLSLVLVAISGPAETVPKHHQPPQQLACQQERRCWNFCLEAKSGSLHQPTWLT